MARLLRTAIHEVQISPHPDPDALKERVSWLLERVEASASRRIGRGMGLLASIGATAPFVGLFGTVWGIMNSFIGISNAHTTNLAVVAPGIAEALLATALGLFAAIPAVVIYNVFSRAIGGYRALLADGSALVMRLLSRDCERVSSAACRARRSSAVAIRLGHDGDDFAETHEINVTPFIDVILVLLIIFMIAAPLATVDVPVDLPATTAQRQQRPDKPIFLTIKADRTLAIGDDPVPREALAVDPGDGVARQPRRAHFPARRPRGDLRRRHGGDERAARGRLSQGRPGRTGGAGGQMTAQRAHPAGPRCGRGIQALEFRRGDRLRGACRADGGLSVAARGRSRRALPFRRR